MSKPEGLAQGNPGWRKNKVRAVGFGASLLHDFDFKQPSELRNRFLQDDKAQVILAAWNNQLRNNRPEIESEIINDPCNPTN